MTWLNLTMPNQTVKNGLNATKIKLSQMNFFSRKTTNKTFMYLLAPFILYNFRKNLTVDPELRGCTIFGPKIAHLSWTKFFGTNHFYYSGHAPSSSLGWWGSRNFTKAFAGGRGVRYFYFGGGGYIVRGRGNFAGGVT